MSTQWDSFRERIPSKVKAEDVEKIRASAAEILDTHNEFGSQCTLALGYVQSGKTTSMSALAALAADRKYRIVITFLGSTNILLEQNTERIFEYLGVNKQEYFWHPITDVKARSTVAELRDRISVRTIIIPLLKLPVHINNLREALEKSKVITNNRVLIVDDEADQASLNVGVKKGKQSPTYKAICELRALLPDHLYVQYTATPYAPLLLEPSDPLFPTKVIFLTPGHGYTGGREFLYKYRSSVVRLIPDADESGKTIVELPDSLLSALANFIIGAKILFDRDRNNAPISMLVHSTQIKDGHRTISYFLKRLQTSIRSDGLDKSKKFYKFLIEEFCKFEPLIPQGTSLANLEDIVKSVLQELTIWEVNSDADSKAVKWHLSPFHLLIGGNKLDRGFTVEGLTVSYMNRKSSEQIDTSEQRARAFGYRQEYIPFCKLFVTSRVFKHLAGVVLTEDDLRFYLHKFQSDGIPVADWARDVGLDLVSGAKPARAAVLSHIRAFNNAQEWHTLRMPSTDPNVIANNKLLVKALGFETAAVEFHGRLGFRRVSIPRSEFVAMLEKWDGDLEVAGLPMHLIMSHIRRNPLHSHDVVVYLMEAGADQFGKCRVRHWDDYQGYINLFQGRDLDNRLIDRFEGDRSVIPKNRDENQIVVQVHHVNVCNRTDNSLFTLAINLGDRQIVTRGS